MLNTLLGTGPHGTVTVGCGVAVPRGFTVVYLSALPHPPIPA